MRAKARAPSPPQAGAPAAPAKVVALGASSLRAAIVTRFDEQQDRITLRAAEGELVARRAPWLDPAVLRTAEARGEPLILQLEEGEWVAIGALRTAATPGVDEAEQFEVVAERLRFHARQELSLTSGAAQLVLSAIGRVETLAHTISSRALSVHRIVGRMLHLN